MKIRPILNNQIQENIAGGETMLSMGFYDVVRGPWVGPLCTSSPMGVQVR